MPERASRPVKGNNTSRAISRQSALVALAEQSKRGALLDFGDEDDWFLADTQLAALDKDFFTFT